MNSDYGRALNGFHSQMAAYGQNAEMFQQSADLYATQLQTAKEGAIKKISDDKITDAVSAVAGLGAYAAKKVSLEDFKKRVEAGAFKGDTYRGYADKLRAKASELGKSEDSGTATSGEAAGAETSAMPTEAADIDENPFSIAGGDFQAEAMTGDADVVIDSAKTTLNFGVSEDGELIGTGAEEAGETVGGAEGELIGNTIGGEAGQAAAETTTAATTGIGDAAEGIAGAASTVSDTVAAAGAATSGAVEAGIGIGTQVATDSALAVAGGLDAVGTFLDATGIGAGVGVILQVAAVGEGIAGAYDAGKEIYDNVKKVGTDAVQSAQNAVQKVGVIKENWASVLPTYDTSELIHSSGAW